MAPQGKNWAFTIFEFDEILLAKMYNDHDGIQYIVFQEEIAPTTGSHHLQGYVQFKEKQYLKGCKKTLTGDPNKNGKFDLQYANSTAVQTARYCTVNKLNKQGEPDTSWIPGTQFEWGQMVVTTRDWKEYASVIQKGEMNLKQVMEESPSTFVQFHKGFQVLAVESMPDRDMTNPPEVLWYWGSTGTGKTRKAWEDNPELYVYSGKDMFFNGYNGEETVLFDDYRGQFPFNFLLRLLDRYPMRVDIKGGNMKWRAKKIIITSAMRPEDVYDKEKFHKDDHIAQLMRRITNVVHFDKF